MKIIMYSVRSEEQPFIDAYVKAHENMNVESHAEDISSDNVEWAKGFDGICILPKAQITRSMLEQIASYGIKIFATRSVGFEVIDLVAAKDLGIKVTNVPSYSPSAIAEFAVATTLDLLRNTPAVYDRIAHQNFDWQGLMGQEINGQTVGIVGTGHIGAVAARAFAGFGAHVIAYDMYQNKSLADLVTYVDTLDNLFAQANIISFHCPLTPENTHCVNDKTIAEMKPGVRLVNTARGKLIDSAALLRGLQSGQVGGAALDVYEYEGGYFNHNWEGKKIEDPTLQAFLDMPNVIITPHIAFYTHTAISNMIDYSIQSIIDVVNTGSSKNEVY